ncbi:hypothetical protein AP1_0415 [Aeromonas phage AP1]|nr:hypothetical protein AP1_0415 [Aeromonas phage AP1]
MKVQFKSEEAMTEFKTLDRNNEELANAYGMFIYSKKIQTNSLIVKSIMMIRKTHKRL